MPLTRGHSNKVVSENIRELHHGKTYARTRRKYGAKKAHRQAIAIAMHEAGRSRMRYG